MKKGRKWEKNKKERERLALPDIKIYCQPTIIKFLALVHE